MRTVVQRRIGRTWIILEESDPTGSVTHIADEPQRELDAEAWDKTDRQFQFPKARVTAGPGTQVLHNNPARTRWLEENDIHTQFLDAGIGCCWFAQQGDQEPVSGETEEEAIERLARQNGIQLWDETEHPVGQR